jgi:D-alanyl-D-alanine carboxypeptidase
MAEAGGNAAVHDAIAGATSHLLSTGAVPGGVVCVVGPDDALDAVPFGVVDLATRRPVDQRTRFEIGSISKSFTALVVLQLVDQGRLTLDDAADQHLPWLQVSSAHEPFAIRHLLQHTAGLVMGSDAIPDELAQVWSLRHTTTGSAPGSFFHYSNLGYVVLGQIVRAVTGRACADVVAERVLGPVGMVDSLARIGDGDRPTLATGYQPRFEDRPFLPGDPLEPATWFGVEAADGNIAATGTDLGRYLAMLLARGHVSARADASVVSQESFAQMVGSLAHDGEPSQYPSRYGLGLNVEQISGSTCVSHGGGMVGYASFLIGDLDRRVGVAVMTNAPGDSPTAELLARQVFSQVQRAAGVEGVTDHEPWPPLETPSAAGRWSDEHGSFAVATDEGVPWLSDDDGMGRLVRLSVDRWGCTHPSWRTFSHVIDLASGRWSYGGRVLSREGTSVLPKADIDAVLATAVGHYRSYSPWWTHLRIVARGERLHLIADNGVEANKDQPVLVRSGADEFRVGADERLPERLRLGPVVDGNVIWVDRDGCRYSRTARS